MPVNLSKDSVPQVVEQIEAHYRRVLRETAHRQHPVVLNPDPLIGGFTSVQPLLALNNTDDRIVVGMWREDRVNARRITREVLAQVTR